MNGGLRVRTAPRVAEDGSIRGYAAIFGETDLAGDIIEPGAFAASVLRRGMASIAMLWQHDPGRPVGRWTGCPSGFAPSWRVAAPARPGGGW